MIFHENTQSLKILVIYCLLGTQNFHEALLRPSISRKSTENFKKSLGITRNSIDFYYVSIPSVNLHHAYFRKSAFTPLQQFCVLGTCTKFMRHRGGEYIQTIDNL